MKTIAFSLLLITMVVGLSNAQNVEIPDTAFLYALIDEGVDTNGDSLISYAEAEAINSLDISTETDTLSPPGTGSREIPVGKIKSLLGIEAFANLDTLICSGNNIDSLDLSNNNGLLYINCRLNGYVANFFEDAGGIQSLNISNCESLTYLNCSNNKLILLDVSNNTALRELYCNYNKKLNSIDAGGIQSLNLSFCKTLTHLDCAYNRLTSLDVSGVTALETLDCWNNQLTSLDVSTNTALIELYCQESQLTSLDVSKNTALTVLYCGVNQLTSLDVSNNTLLNDLDCSDNQLTSLDVSGFTALAELNCDENQLTIMNVSGCTSLTELYCARNQLTSLDISGFTALTVLYCREGQLTSLDASGCNALSILYCGENQLTSLDISGCTNLEVLWVRFNPLRSLDISGFTALKWLGIDNMPYLGQICVWNSFPSGVEVEDWNSPNVYYTTECNVGVEEYSFNGLSIFPNPVNDLLTVEVKLPEQHTIKITSLNGQLLYTDRMDSPTHQIDLSSFEKGLYLLTIRSGDYVRTEKIIKL